MFILWRLWARVFSVVNSFIGGQIPFIRLQVSDGCLSFICIYIYMYIFYILYSHAYGGVLIRSTGHRIFTFSFLFFFLTHDKFAILSKTVKDMRQERSTTDLPSLRKKKKLTKTQKWVGCHSKLTFPGMQWHKMDLQKLFLEEIWLCLKCIWIHDAQPKKHSA